jgi:general secretion pathway protein L
MQKLVILLHADDLAHPGWAVVDDAGQVVLSVDRGDPAAMAVEAKNRVNIVIVPSEDVLLTNVTLPKMSRSRLLQAIPYALEEQVIEDVETMHFAPGEYHADEQLSVVVTARSKMTEWMTLLQSYDVKADVMIPGIFALPYSDAVWHAIVNHVAAVRTSFTSGFACDRNNLVEMISLAVTATETPPHEIEIVEIDGNHEALHLSLPVTATENKMTAVAVLEMMAREAVNKQPLNMLQGEFQNKKARGLPRMTNLLKTAAYLGIAWIALAFLYPVVSFSILDQRAQDIKNQIAAIYKKEFPNSSSIVAPKERMQQKLNKLSSGVGDNHLLMMMASIGKALSASSGVTLKRMDFQNNVMTLEISALTSNVFTGFTDVLAKQGLRVKQQNANISGARVNATLEIE